MKESDDGDDETPGIYLTKGATTVSIHIYEKKLDTDLVAYVKQFSGR